jgi:hypothetical protein
MGRRQLKPPKTSSYEDTASSSRGSSSTDSTDGRLDAPISLQAPKSRTRRGRTHVCPQCLGTLVRVQRSSSDRLRGLFAPVRRFRCHRFGCGFEVTLRRRVSVKRRLLLALGGLLAAFAGALVTGGFLYSLFDAPTRRDVMDGYLNFMEYQTDKFNDYVAATPTPESVIDLQHEAALPFDPLPPSQLADIALGVCVGAQTTDCRPPTVTSPARRVGLQE